MRRALIFLALLPASIAASAPIAQREPVDEALRLARGEAEAARKDVARLTALAGKQRDEAGRLRARQEAAASAIAAAEAEISIADAQARILAEQLAARRAELRRQQAPATALLGGLAIMAQRPPLLALAEGGGTDDFVRVRLLLDTTLPVIRRRTASLSQQIAQGRRLADQLALARKTGMDRRTDLQARQAAFAALEQQAIRLADRTGLAALGAGDVALSRGEAGHQLATEQQRSRSAALVAAELAGLGAPPPRPFAPEGNMAAPLAFQLPADVAVTDGYGSISENGIRSRGITLTTRRGAPLIAPADATILFAGPYRNQDGIIILDHGGGWKSLILNAATDLAKGSRIRRGEPIGRALGPIGLELSRNGQHHSPALIAGSSAALSKMRKSR